MKVAEIGFEVAVVVDATFTFARRDRRGHLWAADYVYALSLANLEQGGYARVTETSAQSVTSGPAEHTESLSGA